MKKTPGWLGCIGDEKLPSYIGILISQYMDPYQTISMMESKSFFFRGSIVESFVILTDSVFLKTKPSKHLYAMQNQTVGYCTYTLPKTNVAPENGPLSRDQVPGIYQVPGISNIKSCQRLGDYDLITIPMNFSAATMSWTCLEQTPTKHICHLLQKFHEAEMINDDKWYLYSNTTKNRIQGRTFAWICYVTKDSKTL